MALPLETWQARCIVDMLMSSLSVVIANGEHILSVPLVSFSPTLGLFSVSVTGCLISNSLCYHTLCIVDTKTHQQSVLH